MRTRVLVEQVHDHSADVNKPDKRKYRGCQDFDHTNSDWKLEKMFILAGLEH